MSREIHLDTEIRKLEIKELFILGNILNISDSWKELMSIVPEQDNVLKFNSEHIRIIEKTAYEDKRNAAQIFLDEWSTMGKERPTLKLLLNLLIEAKLYRAADYVAHILKQERPKRPDNGPAASIDTSDVAINQILNEQMLPQNTFANPIILESTSELPEINEIYPSEKLVDVQVQEYKSELSSEELPAVLNNYK